MSPTSYQTAPPRGGPTRVAAAGAEPLEASGHAAVHGVDRGLDLGVGVDDPLHLLPRRGAFGGEVLAREEAFVRLVLADEVLGEHVEVHLVGTVHHRHG